MTATVRTTGTTDSEVWAREVEAGLPAIRSESPDPAGRPGPGRRPGRHLRPVEPAPRRSTRRAGKRSPAVPVIVGAGIVITALFALAAMHALLIGGQLRLDDLRREQASSAEEVRRLRLEVAELEAPDRVLDVARDRLGMVDPGEVGYLLPAGVDGGEDGPIRVEPAQTPPPPPAPVADTSRSAEEQEVDAALSDGTAEDPSADGDPTEGGASGSESPAADAGAGADTTADADPTVASEGATDGVAE